jgi:hypothetical protein
MTYRIEYALSLSVQHMYTSLSFYNIRIEQVIGNTQYQSG